MNTRRSVSSAAAATKVAAAAALVLAATAVAGGTAWADGAAALPPCAHGTAVLPGETPVQGGPAHSGTVALEVTGDAKPTVQGDVTTYRVRVTETNRTGADYRHVTLLPIFFTQLGVMNGDNAKVFWEHGGSSVALPTRPGCDPSAWVDSAALDVPLANGQSASFDLRITTSTPVAEKVKEIRVGASAWADGTSVTADSFLQLPGVPRAAEPTKAPTATPTKAATPTPTATPTKAPAASATPTATAATPAPAAASAELASTGGGSNTGLLAAAAALLIAAGGAVLYTLRRRTR
ncbi:LAETG motif-containing sortase-dependent surface protein [Kitasatospora sp. NRRL B-11411]|uniref:LAETG motif-containing sortase-dependent surface protein n=1 Tax=Kitasatospora sp. NRRL B-11411 TaxID=1463822 RepID=UPI0012FF0C16|nr:LAETG motif-containing sortase-dependent surface protein [Kitasatospora sp. NRRL B-11411]